MLCRSVSSDGAKIHVGVYAHLVGKLVPVCFALKAQETVHRPETERSACGFLSPAKLAQVEMTETWDSYLNHP